MTESDRPRGVDQGWKWYQIVAVILLSLVGMGAFAAWRIDRAIHRVTGGGVGDFFRDPKAAMARGFLVTLRGDIPGAPRQARISMSSTDTGKGTVLRAELRLLDTLPGDSAAAWAGKCLHQGDGMELSVEPVAPGAAPRPDSVPGARGLIVMSAGQAIGELPNCDRGSDARRR